MNKVADYQQLEEDGATRVGGGGGGGAPPMLSARRTGLGVGDCPGPFFLQGVCVDEAKRTKSVLHVPPPLYHHQLFPFRGHWKYQIQKVPVFSCRSVRLSFQVPVSPGGVARVAPKECLPAFGIVGPQGRSPPGPPLGWSGPELPWAYRFQQLEPTLTWPSWVGDIPAGVPQLVFAFSQGAGVSVCEGCRGSRS